MSQLRYSPLAHTAYVFDYFDGEGDPDAPAADYVSLDDVGIRGVVSSLTIAVARAHPWQWVPIPLDDAPA